MAIYTIWSGGDGTQTNTTQSATTLDWSKSDTSVANLIAYDANAFTTSGNVIYFADDHSDPNKAANWTLTGPTSGLPVILISADRTQSTPTYKAGTGAQLSSLGGAYSMTLDGCFGLYGVRAVGGGGITLDADADEQIKAESCTFVIATNSGISAGTTSSTSIGKVQLDNCVIDLSADAPSARSTNVINHQLSRCVIRSLSFVNAGYRTGGVFGANTNCNALDASGLDLSGFTNATLCEVMGATAGAGTIELSNIKTASTWALSTVAPQSSCRLMATNIGPDDAPTALYLVGFTGSCISTSSIYRSGGAQIGTTPTAWLITTTASCGESAPFYTPWIYGRVNSTGSRTFDCYITNDTGDLTDAEAWLEVEFLSESGEAIWDLASDQRVITATAVAQTDDTTSTWTGTGPAFTYKQKLSVTATVNQAGQYRVRVAVGKTSVAGSRYLYIDPAVTVS